VVPWPLTFLMAVASLSQFSAHVVFNSLTGRTLSAFWTWSNGSQASTRNNGMENLSGPQKNQVSVDHLPVGTRFPFNDRRFFVFPPPCFSLFFLPTTTKHFVWVPTRCVDGVPKIPRFPSDIFAGLVWAPIQNHVLLPDFSLHPNFLW